MRSERNRGFHEGTPILHMLTPADLVSMANAALGLVAIFLISLGQASLALVAILLAVLGDGVDGAVARSGHGGGPFGTKLDSFADFTAFAIAPAAFLVTAYYPGLPGAGLTLAGVLPAVLVVVAAGLFVLAGMLRLIRYEVLQAARRDHYFIGLSIPGAGLLVALVANLGWALPAAVFVAVGASFLMVSRLRFPKVRGALMPPAAAIILLAAVLGSRYEALELLLVSMLVVYILMGPFVVRWRDRRLDELETPWDA